METKEKRKLVFDFFKNNLKDYLSFTKEFKIKFSMAEGGYVWQFSDGTIFDLGISFVSEHYPKGCFGVYTSFVLSQGPVIDLINKSQASRNRDATQVVMGNSINIINKFDDYQFISDDISDIERETQNLSNDIRFFYTDYILAFVEDYPKAIDFLINDILILKKLVIQNPFATSIALMKLTNDFSRLDKLLLRAKNDFEFYDFHQMKDYSKKIIEPIMKFQL